MVWLPTLPSAPKNHAWAARPLGQRATVAVASTVTVAAVAAVDSAPWIQEKIPMWSEELKLNLSQRCTDALQISGCVYLRNDWKMKMEGTEMAKWRICLFCRWFWRAKNSSAACCIAFFQLCNYRAWPTFWASIAWMAREKVVISRMQIVSKSFLKNVRKFGNWLKKQKSLRQYLTWDLL